ncbi:uncharacterized protein EV420DRAFT_356687 [Desarmillaria tabescens]|uniref:Mid2 domain-containing protein n=1 Tax=Armillaria tabescens TaxID=1929756 RepID=A0AA39KC62_ARMTA|nr:uncharacterized protein EV420DRAFT_356687 [Desarmillaria tabescens]KAK0458467.1 hypothetical protein EV420DRAFT_356687 [Desarmillaria tabescens]
MSFPLFRLCTFIALIPLVFSLNITLNDAPVAFQYTPISLRWTQDDPLDFILGAFLIHSDESLMVATTTRVVDNFTADLTAVMTFNYTSTSDKDCILIAWISGTEPHNQFTQSEPFSVGSKPRMTTPSSESIPVVSTPTPSKSTYSSTTLSPITPSPIPSVLGTAQPTKKAIPTDVIVGIVIGSVALLSMVSTTVFIVLWRRRNRKLKNSAPSRAFWKQFDRKGPPISQPVRQPLPAYTQGRTYQRPAVRPPSLKLDEYYLRAGKI